ncbi:MAG: NAD-dependent epimerase/dehydratase family protein [Planctomycetota bacterium]|jgi:UDP-glucose 4-epimerase
MRYLITGGAGFIGSHLAEKLLGQGDDVTVLDDFSSGSYENLCELPDKARLCIVEGDVRDACVDEMVKECDTVFHLAALVGVEQVVQYPRRTVSVTVEGGANVLAACVRHRRPLLVTSTSEVYGDNPTQPLREDFDLRIGPPTTPRWSYAAAKLLEEQMVLSEGRASGLPAVVVRLFNTVGPRQTGRYGMVLPRFVQAALDEGTLPVYGDGRQTRTFCDVRDVVSALSLVIGYERAWGKVVNVGSDSELSIIQLSKLVLNVIGGGGRAKFAEPGPLRGGFREIRRRVPDTTALHELIGDWRVYPLNKTIQAIAKHVNSCRAGAAAEEN